MKNIRLVLISCLATTALVASPALGQMPQRRATVQSSTPRTVTSAKTGTMARPSTSRITVRPSTNRAATSGRAGIVTQNRTFNNNEFVFDTFGSPFFYPYGYYPYNGYDPYSYSYYGDYYPHGYSYYSGSSYGDNVVAAVQQRLAELGYYHGVIDGVVGPQTRAAINAYEANHGLVVDGTISRPLLDSMGLS